jgi:uncharacterized membrane protein YqjE
VTASSSPAPKPTPRPAPSAASGSGATPPGSGEPPATAKPTPPVPGAAAGTAGAGPITAAGAAVAPGRPVAEPSVGQLVSDVSTHMSTLIRSEIELAKLELRSTVKNGLTGAGMFVGAAILLVFSLIYFFQAIAETLDRYLVPRWVAFFIVFGLLVVVAALLVFLGIKKVKRVRAPEKTIRTTKETVDFLKKSRG